METTNRKNPRRVIDQDVHRLQVIGDRVLITQDGTEVMGSEALAGKVVVFYFAAMFCGNCGIFTPKFTRFYEAAKEAGKPLEVILLSKGEEEDDFLEHSKEKNGPWLAVKFGDEHIQNLENAKHSRHESS